MNLDIYEGKEPTASRLSMPLMLLNAMFACAVVFWWAFASLLLADPINWAAARHMNARPDLFDYPFVMLWAMPVLAVLTGWVTERLKIFKLSVALLAFPLCYFGLILAIYYFAPPEWK